MHPFRQYSMRPKAVQAGQRCSISHFEREKRLMKRPPHKDFWPLSEANGSLWDPQGPNRPTQGAQGPYSTYKRDAVHNLKRLPVPQ